MNGSDLVTVDEAKQILGVTTAEMSVVLSRGELALYSAPGLRAGVAREDVERLRLQRPPQHDESK